MNIKPFSKKQLQTLSWWCNSSPHSDCDAIICDGAVRSGKTFCMFLSFVFWAFYRYNNCSFAVCGKTINSVKRNIITPLIPQLEALGFKCRLILSRSQVEIEREGRRNLFYLFGGKDEASASLIQGMTLCGVLFDEVALMPRSFVEQALARCSTEGSKFWFNCNPEHPSHWFYTEWIKKADEKNALYLHFTMEENPALSPKILNRYKSLYSGAFYERYVLGLWVCAEGQIYPMFGENNLCDAPDECRKFYISCDYGTVNPASFGLWGHKNGIWYRIAEYYYDSKRAGEQKTDEEYYIALKALADGRRIEAVVCDPSAASFMACIRKHGHFRVIPAKNEVLDGIRRVSDQLKSGKLKICRCCKDTIREFSLYRWDEGAVRDIPRKENDHAMDDIRYFVSTIMYSGGFGPVALTARRDI